jgi:transposase
LAPPLAQSVKAHLELRRAIVKALREQSGVGTMSAIRLVVELADINRFPTAASLPHYLGLTPSQYTSGETDHRGHIMKCGPVMLRALLLQCAWAAVRRGLDQDLVPVVQRLAPRIGRKRAIVAVARRLAIKLRRRWLQAISPTLAADATA